MRSSKECFCKQKPLLSPLTGDKITPVGRKTKFKRMKNRGGRPHKIDSQLRKKVVSTRLTETEYSKLLEEAERCYLSLSDFIYQILTDRKVVPRISKEEMDILRKLAGQSNNLNQLTKLAHTAGIETVVIQLSELNDEVLKFINLLSDDRKNNTG